MAFPLTAEQEVPSKVAIGLHVADDGLDGGGPAQLASDGGRDAAFLAGDEDLSALGFHAVAAISAINIGAGDGNACDPLHLLDLAGQRVAVIRVARQMPRYGPRTDRPCSDVSGWRGRLSRRIHKVCGPCLCRCTRPPAHAG